MEEGRILIYKLFIDDERFPPEGKEDEYVIARTPAEAMKIMAERGCPIFISFDHDLGGSLTAMQVVRAMVEMDMDFLQAGESFIPPEFGYYVHSQNPIGAANIRGLLNSYLEKRKWLYGNIPNVRL